MKVLNTFTIVIAGVFVVASCATIISGTKQKMSISSNPSGATVYLDNVELGKTPYAATIQKGDKKRTLKIVLQGYLPYELVLVPKVDAWIAGNIIFGGLIGLIVDAASGAMYKLTPEQVQAELKAATGSIKQLHNGIYIGTVLQPNPDWAKIGTLEKE